MHGANAVYLSPHIQTFQIILLFVVEIFLRCAIEEKLIEPKLCVRGVGPSRCGARTKGTFF